MWRVVGFEGDGVPWVSVPVSGGELKLREGVGGVGGVGGERESGGDGCCGRF